jgi:undecaprenyl-phosphate galactose phosphotransferase
MSSYYLGLQSNVLEEYRVEDTSTNTIFTKLKIYMKNIFYRSFDVVFSLSAIISLAPIMLLVFIFIKIKSPNSPVFFKQERLGLYGKPFYIYKFRTMVPNAEIILKKLLEENTSMKKEFEKDFKLKNDPRIIPGIGSFLRKSSLDELPQFLNSLLGDLSIVGPRPIVKAELELYGDNVNKLHSIKPGITGLWQVSGRNDIEYEERIALDMQYIDTKSFIGDLKIILYTVKGMITKDGI